MTMNFKINLAVFLSALAAIAVHAEHQHVHGEGCSHGHPAPHGSQFPTLVPELAAFNHSPSTCSDKPKAPDSNFQARSFRIERALQETMGLKTAKAEQRRIFSSVNFAGRYELNPDARKVVATPVSGRVSLLVRPLADIKKGDALFRVFSPDLVARSREIALLEKRLSVYREIKTANAALENELAVKRAEREAILAGAEEKNGIVTVCAADDAMVESLPAKDGAWLETGAAAVETVRPHDLRFKALVAASDVINLKDGMPAKTGKNEGKLKIGVGDDSGLVPVYVLFAAQADAIAGERGYAECVTDPSEKTRLAVPSRSIVPIGVQSVVFVKDAHDPELFTAIPVFPGASGNGWTAISLASHLSRRPLEVVTDGAYELKLAQLQGGDAKPAGHFHADGTFHEGEH
jgi:hypothetical protein